MGNHQSSSPISCFQFSILSKPEKRQKSAALFDAKGNFLRRVDLPLRAAELMLEEELRHVICTAENLRRTRRFTALKADEELVADKSYVLVTPCKLGHRVSNADMDVLESACKDMSTSNKNKNNKKVVSSRVSPAMAEDSVKEEEDDDDDSLIRVLEESFDITVGVTDLGFMCRKRGYCRGWRPDLDTINEACSS